MVILQITTGAAPICFSLPNLGCQCALCVWQKDLQMKKMFVFLFIISSWLLSAAEQGNGVSLFIQVTKTEIHHLEPVSIILEIVNNGKEDFIMKSSMVCSRFESKINFGAGSLASNEEFWPGSVVIPPGKTQKLLLPDRVFSLGEHNVFVDVGFAYGLKPMRSNEVIIKVRKATNEEANIWTKECYDLYEKLKIAEIAGNEEDFLEMYDLLLSRIRHEDLFSIPIITKILDDGISALDSNDIDNIINLLAAKIYHNQKNKELVTKSIDIKYVISTTIKELKTKDEKKVNGFDLVGSNLMPWMSKDEKDAYKECLKEFIRSSNNGDAIYPIALTLLSDFPEEYKVVETTLQVTGLINKSRERESLKKLIERSIERIKQKRITNLGKE